MKKLMIRWLVTTGLCGLSAVAGATTATTYDFAVAASEVSDLGSPDMDFTFSVALDRSPQDYGDNDMVPVTTAEGWFSFRGVTYALDSSNFSSRSYMEPGSGLAGLVFDEPNHSTIVIFYYVYNYETGTTLLTGEDRPYLRLVDDIGYDRAWQTVYLLDSQTLNITPAPIPEPATPAMLIGAISLFALARNASKRSIPQK